MYSVASRYHASTPPLDEGSVQRAPSKWCVRRGNPLVVGEGVVRGQNLQYVRKTICARASPSDGIPGLDSPNGVETPSGQYKEDPCRVTGHDEGRAGLRKSPCSAGWEDECDITSNLNSATYRWPK